MYAQAGGATPNKSLLTGLAKKPGDVGAFAKGQAMANAADLNFQRAQNDQQTGVQQMKAESGLRQQGNQNQAQRAGNEVQERVAKGGLQSRQAVFNTGMDFDYATLRKRQQMNLRQALLNNMARDF